MRPLNSRCRNLASLTCIAAYLISVAKVRILRNITKKTTFNYMGWCKSIEARAALQAETRWRRHVVGCNWLWLLQIKLIYMDVKAKSKRQRTVTPIGLCPTPTRNDTPICFRPKLVVPPTRSPTKAWCLWTTPHVNLSTTPLVNLSTCYLVNSQSRQLVYWSTRQLTLSSTR